MALAHSASADSWRPMESRSLVSRAPILHRWRIQSYGLVDACWSYSSVSAKVAAVSENSSSRRSHTPRSAISSSARSSCARADFGRWRKLPTADWSAAIADGGWVGVLVSPAWSAFGAAPPTPTLTRLLYTNICSWCQESVWPTAGALECARILDSQGCAYRAERWSATNP